MLLFPLKDILPDPPSRNGMLIILSPLLVDIPENPLLLMDGMTALSLRVTLEDLALRIAELLIGTPLLAAGMLEMLLLILLFSTPLLTVGGMTRLLGTVCNRGSRTIARSLVAPLAGMAPLVRITLVSAILFPLILAFGSRRMIL